MLLPRGVPHIQYAYSSFLLSRCKFCTYPYCIVSYADLPTFPVCFVSCWILSLSSGVFPTTLNLMSSAHLINQSLHPLSQIIYTNIENYHTQNWALRDPAGYLPPIRWNVQLLFGCSSSTSSLSNTLSWSPVCCNLVCPSKHHGDPCQRLYKNPAKHYLQLWETQSSSFLWALLWQLFQGMMPSFLEHE